MTYTRKQKEDYKRRVARRKEKEYWDYIEQKGRSGESNTSPRSFFGISSILFGYDPPKKKVESPEWKLPANYQHQHKKRRH